MPGFALRLPSSLVTLYQHLRTNLTLAVAVFMMALAFSFSAGFAVGASYPRVLGRQTTHQALPLVPPDPNPEQPLRKYSIQNLQQYPYQLSTITLERILETNPDFTAYLFSYKTLGKKMTGQLNLPRVPADQELPVIIMVRGYVDPEEFQTGVGTAGVAREFAKAGYVTIAPDFLGFGGSDPAGPGWEERFEKPVNMIELIQSVRKHSAFTFKEKTVKINPQQLGVWAHSNGGQISLTTLEALGEPIPTTLWAPVTAAFPYSVLFYSDEMDDGGTSMRAAIAGFERAYNVEEYSLTQYISRLRGPLQLHQGTADDAVPKKWSDEFVKKIKQENDRRQRVSQQRQAEAAAAAALAMPSAQPTPVTASAAARPTQAATGAAILAEEELFPIGTISTQLVTADVFLLPIELNYFVYPNGNHFIRPGWDEAVARDLRFFDQHLRARR